MKTKLIIHGRECLLYECGEQPQVLLIQPLGVHERNTIDNEVALISEAVKGPFVMVAMAVNDWEAELTPWHDPKLSKRQEVGDHGITYHALATIKQIHDDNTMEMD